MNLLSSTASMVDALKKYTELLYLLLWLVVGLVLAGNTELYVDEAYYWVYSRFLDWGYFDHPPMIAVMIKLGTLLFGSQSELGVRFFSVLLSAGAIALIYRLANKPNIHLFFLSVFSMLSLNVLGFMALPDVPLLFFGTLFFWMYQRFSANKNALNAILLGLIAAALLYSKYHGVLIIGFTFLSNWQLIKEKYSYLALVTLLVAFFPHVWWLIENEFPTFKYHLVDRNASEYSVKFTLEYLLGNIPSMGGWVSIALFVAAIMFKSENALQRALKWNLIGIMVFFLAMSFKGYVEANWTFPVVVPMVVLGVQKIAQTKYVKTYSYSAGVMLLLVLVLKIHILSPLVDVSKDRTKDFHENKAFVEAVFEKLDDKPTVTGRYQMAGALSFYGPKQEIIPSVNYKYRFNHFALLKLDTVYYGQTINYVDKWVDGDTIIWKGELVRVGEIRNYKGFEIKEE